MRCNASTFASTFASTPLRVTCNLLICNRIYFLKLLIILWSQVQVLVGPPIHQGYILETSLTVCTGHIVNTLGPNGFCAKGKDYRSRLS